MITSPAISMEQLLELHDWLAAESASLFEAKRQCLDEESRVRLHVAAQDAHRIAADLEQFAYAHRRLETDGLIDG